MALRVVEVLRNPLRVRYVRVAGDHARQLPNAIVRADDLLARPRRNGDSAVFVVINRGLSAARRRTGRLAPQSVIREARESGSVCAARPPLCDGLQQE